jgi:hypothetical protein
MRKHLFLPLALVCALALAACGDSGSMADKLNGKWQCDVKATMALMQQKSPEALQGMEALLEGILSVTSAEFDTKAGKLILDVGGMSETQSFTLSSEKGKTVVLKMDDESLLNLEFRNDDSIVFQDGDDADKQLIMSRVK